MSALGALLGGGGGGAAGGGGSPDELLSQIVDLMQQYLALGSDTPAYDAVSSALPAIQESMTVGGAGGYDGDGTDSESGSDSMNDQTDTSPMATMHPSSQPKSFSDASEMALQDMKKKKPKAAPGA
jgi:hypothetical protein